MRYSVFTQMAVGIGDKPACCFTRRVLPPQSLGSFSVKSPIYEDCRFRHSNSSLINLKPLELVLPLSWGTCSKGLMHNGEPAGRRFVVSI